MSTLRRPLLTPEQYLEIEEAAEFKSDGRRDATAHRHCAGSL
jgi:hypothetical protein